MTNVNISASSEPQKPASSPAPANQGQPQASPPKPADKSSEQQK